MANESSPARHSTFRIERLFAVPRARVYAAFSNLDAKSRWFTAPPGGWTLLERRFDFRAGGEERLRGRWNSGMVSDFHAHYWEIVAERRIVYAYEMHLDDKRISVSLATVEFFDQGDGTRLVVTEQGVFLNGYDDAGSREQGTRLLLDQLAKAMEA